MAQDKAQLISRRQLLQRTAAVGVAVAGSGWILAGCGKKKAAALSCTDTSSLNAQQLQTRQTLSYQEPSPKPDQHCSVCRFFTSKGDNACGSCTIVPGPINPKGWCKSWTAKT